MVFLIRVVFLVKKNNENYQALSHFSEELSKNIKSYCTDTVLLKSRYIFTYKLGNIKMGYCTHCKKDYFVNGLKHNEPTICPHCSSKCIVKASGMHRKNLRDEAYFVYYEKSKKDPNVIVARGIYVYRSYNEDYRKVETIYSINALYVFEVGKSKMYTKNYWSYGRCYGECKSIYSLYNQGHISTISSICCYESLERAVKKTPFQYSMYEEYLGNKTSDMVEYLSLYSKYPLIESFTKIGLKEIVEAKLFNSLTYGAVYWNGKTIFKMLRLNRKELSDIVNCDSKVDCELLRYYQLARKTAPSITYRQVKSYVKDYRFNFQTVSKLLKYISLPKLDTYLNKQYNLNKQSKGLNRKTDVIGIWFDYITNCEKLMADLESDSILFPKNVYEAHDKAVKKIKVLGNLLYDRKIEKRLETLKKYCFTNKGLLIRPAESTQELIKEGEKLHHCVAINYTTPYVNGKTIILLIRKESEPNKPYYTAELKNGVFIQIQGYRHSAPNEEVNNFIKDFKVKILKKEVIKKLA
jgi:DNA-directed RNA polymerase subunit RPC12/RpoP